MEGPGLPRRGGAHSDTGPGGAGWRGWAGRWLRSSAAPVPLNTPRPTWRTLNLDWPPLSANPSATAIPTLHRARRGHGAARGERAPRGHGGAGARRAPSGRNGSRNAAGIGAAAGQRDRRAQPGVKRGFNQPAAPLRSPSRAGEPRSAPAAARRFGRPQILHTGGSVPDSRA
ncbi:collagen alpha-2(I) chain-like [Corapipo altera]|uniref:collagen alpha-2(I) chain-like n=1 Tax=Corapipo altera TaxID=415028 RepID=UPI000FD6A5DB|nr:collagen alpha-2(I) chain-like [Corapipo altera]